MRFVEAVEAMKNGRIVKSNDDRQYRIIARVDTWDGDTIYASDIINVNVAGRWSEDDDHSIDFEEINGEWELMP